MVRVYERRDRRIPVAWTRHETTLADLQTITEDQDTTAKQGDILMVRSGYVRRHNQASPEERMEGAQKNSQAIGVQSSEAVVRWLCDQHFAAHVGDTVAFEAWPLGRDNAWVLHAWSLGRWGAQIGEMWNLEKLAEECGRHKRWTFMVTSASLNVPGGVGSPPGAMAIIRWYSKMQLDSV